MQFGKALRHLHTAQPSAAITVLAESPSAPGRAPALLQQGARFVRGMEKVCVAWKKKSIF